MAKAALKLLMKGTELLGGLKRCRDNKSRSVKKGMKQQLQAGEFEGGQEINVEDRVDSKGGAEDQMVMLE